MGSVGRRRTDPAAEREDDLGRQAEWGAVDQTPAGCLVEVRRARTTVLAHIEDRPEVESVRRIDGMLKQPGSDPGAASFGRREQSCHRRESLDRSLCGRDPDLRCSPRLWARKTHMTDDRAVEVGDPRFVGIVADKPAAYVARPHGRIAVRFVDTPQQHAQRLRIRRRPRPHIHPASLAATARGVSTAREPDQLSPVALSSFSCINARSCGDRLGRRDHGPVRGSLADVLTGADRDRCLSAYVEQYPDGRSRVKDPDMVHIRVRPECVRHSDYPSDSFGIIETRFDD